ncbi:MAG: nucleotide disphospho-sugar-binding domain-containing protein [Spirillospora sp.]
MRVLFISNPRIGSAFPLVPLAWAVRSAGHDVLFGAAGDGLAVELAGLDVVDVLPGADDRRIRKAKRLADPESFVPLTLPGAGRHTVAPPPGGFVPWALPEFLAVAHAWRPDLIVSDPAQTEGLLVAAALDVPIVLHGRGLLRTAGLPSAIRRNCTAFDDNGWDLPEHIRHIGVAPASILLSEPDGWSMRPVPYNGGGVLADWPHEPSRRILLTLGTAPVGTHGSATVERIVALAGRVDAEFVLALGDQATAIPGALPRNVRSVGWVPLSTMLRSCAAVVHHGGAGTTLCSLDAGVPQLVVPDGAEAVLHADAVVSRGCGLRCRPDELDEDVLTSLTGAARFRANAAEVRAELAAMPAPADLVPRLAELADAAEAARSASVVAAGLPVVLGRLDDRGSLLS